MDNDLKLNIYRFGGQQIDIASGKINITGDESGLKKATKEATKDLETLDKSLTKTSTNLSNFGKTPVWSGKELTGVRTAIRRYKDEFKQMQELAVSPFASPKFKAQYQTALAKDQMTGMSKIKLKDASSISQGQANKLLSAGERIQKQNITELVKQEKQLSLNTQDATSSLIKQDSFLGKYNIAMNAATKATNSLSTAFKQKIASLRHAAVSWRILYGAFSQIWNVLSGTVEKAAAYQEALNLYTVALGDYAEQGKEWANEISEALFLDPKQIMQYTGAFYNLTQGLGVSSDAAYKMSTNLTQLAYDMSSYLNIDIESAHDKIQSAMTGQSRAVASAGIAMQQASLQELAYQIGINKTVSSMTQAEKTYLRYIQIMRSTTNMQGDLARTIVTPENAIRVVKQQFELLGRAIGQVFIPIVMSAIPYVMALTKALRNLANTLANMLGFKIAEIDYSSLTSADTAIEETFDNIGTSAGKGAKAVGDSINRTLAAFDELNVVESKSKGAGGTGGIGGIGSSLPLGDFEKYLDGYDMLQGLTDELSKKTDAAYENLKKLWNVAKGVAAAFAVWKTLKLANSVINWAQAFKEAFVAGKGLPGLLSNFAKGFTSLGEGATILEKLRAGFAKMLGPVGQFVVAVGTSVTACLSAYSIFSKWNMELDDFGKRALATTAIITGLTAAAYLLAGPFAAGATAIAGLAGAFIGVAEAQRKHLELMHQEETYPILFDGIGVSIKVLTDTFKDSTQDLVDYNDKFIKLSDNVQKAEENVTKTQKAFADLQNSISAGLGFEDDVSLEEMVKATNNYIDAINNLRDSRIAYHKAVLNNLVEEGYLTKERYEQMKKDATEAYTYTALLQTDYAEEVKKHFKDLEAGRISQDEYNKRLKETEDKYRGVMSAIDGADSSAAKLFGLFSKKIDLSSPQELKQLLIDMGDEYKRGTEAAKKQRKEYEDNMNAQIANAQYQVKTLEDLQKQREKAGQTLNQQEMDQLQHQRDLIKTLSEERNLHLIELDDKLYAYQAQYKNYLQTIYSEIVQSGADTTEEMSAYVTGIKNTINKELADIDGYNAGFDMLGQYYSGMIEADKHFAPDAIHKLGEVGIKMDGELWYQLQYGFDKGKVRYQQDMEKGLLDVAATAAQSARTAGHTYSSEYISSLVNDLPEVIAKTKYVGFETGLGYLTGWRNAETNKNIVNSINAGVSEVEKALGINSPSKVYAEIGRNMMLGLANGIDEKSPVVQGKISSLISNVNSMVVGTKVEFNFATNVEKSFSTILSKLQTFANKWRTGINNVLSKTAGAFGSIVLDAMNKMRYVTMSYISIPTFAEGGYPTSGDLFMANENGRAEYITSLGNKTAVANQDQMISALTNAITQSIGSINTQSGPIQVYIGNDKVYEGYGQHQNRQADRYGTTYVKI